ncbi:hypothetical protein BC833DRAFT_117329 [Globomyces pollinis-pini]|nr:hypothetical protein BC833DRAFT_117329 [Globomyces pollinis-pini]
MKTNNQSLESFYYGLDSLYWVSVQMFISDIEYKSESGVFWYLTHPIQMVNLTGIAVSLSINSANFSIQLDDGTGIIDCVLWYTDQMKVLQNPCDIKLGDLVSLNGRLSYFRDLKQVVINSYAVESDPNLELLHWAQAMHLKRFIIQHPFEVDPSVKTQLTTLPEFKPQLEKSPYLPEEVEMIKIIKSHVEHIQSFEFGKLGADQELCNAIKTHLDKPKMTPQELLLLIRKYVRILVKEGFIYLKNELTDLHEVISINNLGKELVDIIKNESGNHGFGYTLFDIIMVNLGQKKSFCRLGKIPVKRMLDELVMKDLISMNENGRYRAY